MPFTLPKPMALAVICFAMAAGRACAWDATGHELVARIAWDRMTPEARIAAVNILKAAPPDSHLAQLFDTTQGTNAQRDRTFFLLASTWPDLARGFPNTPPEKLKKKYHHSDWHYVNRFFEQRQPSDAPKDRPDLPIEGQLVSKLEEFQTSLTDTTDPSERAINLAWTLHLVGDIHQPLHNTARITNEADEQNGDRGGNTFLLKGRANLHSYWDGTFSRQYKRRPTDTLDAYINDVAAAVVAHTSTADLQDRLQSGHIDEWSVEGFQTAKTVTYPAPPALERGTNPPQNYEEAVLKVAEPATVLAGFRLAGVLNRTLVTPSPADPGNP